PGCRRPASPSRLKSWQPSLDAARRRVPLDSRALVGEMHRVLRRANVTLAVHLTRASFEERRPPTEQHRREVDAQLVDQTPFERLADDVAPAHDHDVTMR